MKTLGVTVNRKDDSYPVAEVYDEDASALWSALKCGDSLDLVVWDEKGEVRKTLRVVLWREEEDATNI